MVVFRYDRTFEGLLSAVFDAYSRREFPEKLIGEGEPQPMFTGRLHAVETDRGKADRVWRGLEGKMYGKALNILSHCWLSELPGSDELLFRYIRKIFDSPPGVESDFGDPDILEVHQIALKVSREGEHVRQFVRFQKAGDDTFFGAIAPLYNALPLSIPYFRDRFADQKWIVYDTRRRYGYYYDRSRVVEISLPDDPMIGGQLDERLMAEDEKTFQALWRSYFKALTIKERINPKLQRQHMPRRFWKYLPEMEETELLINGSKSTENGRKLLKK